MKKIYSFSLIVATGLVVFSGIGCRKSIVDTTPQNDLDNTTFAQVFVATVNASRNFVYADGAQINGVALSSGSVFPGTGLYAFTFPAGLRAFLVKDTLPATTQVPISFAENLQLGKNYTIFMYDTITTPKQKTVLTNIVVPTDSTARLRFANFVYNPTAVPGIDIFSYLRNTNVVTDLKVSEVTDFIPYASGITDTLYIRETGTLTNIVKFTSSYTTKRSYTLVYRGSYRGTKLATLFTNR